LFITGIFLQKVAHFRPELLLLSCICLFVSLLIFLFFVKNNLTANLTAYLIIMLIGAFYFSIYNIGNSSYPFEKSKIKTARLYGTVDDLELFREYEVRFSIRADSLSTDGILKKCDLTFLCRIRDKDINKLDSLYKILENGNKVKLVGTISRGRERRNLFEFDYQKYLENNGVCGLFTVYETSDIKIVSGEKYIFKQFILNIRRYLDDKITLLHDKNTAALLKGLLIGDRSEITDDINTDFINSGVMHVVAISGQHVVYVLIVFVLLFGRFNTYMRSLFTSLGLLMFLFLTGASPSVFRAVVMSLVVILGYLSNRSVNGFNAICVSAIILLLINPNQLFDPGFQLSYCAVAGMLTFGSYFTKSVNALKIKYGIIRNIILLVLVSLAAQIGTLPLTLYYFGKLSIVGLAANILIVPLSGIVISVGLATLFIIPFSIWIASVFAVVNNVLCSLTLWLVHLMGNFKYSFLFINGFSLSDLILSFGLIIFLLLVFKKFISLKSKTVLIVFIIADVLLLTSIDDANYLPDNKLTVMMIDVGQGDSFFIKFPNGQTALVDAGDASEYFDNGEKVIWPVLSRLGVQKMDYAFVSHLDADHYGGFISLIKNGKINNLFFPSYNSTSAKEILFRNFAENNGVKVSNYDTSGIAVGNTRLYFIGNKKNNSNSSKNDNSGVIYLKYGNVSFLFTGDIEKKEELYLAKKYKSFLKADVLKIAHHGSKTSSSIEFLKAVSPKIALISVGETNKFKHPSPEVISRLNNLGIVVLRTDKMKQKILFTEGNNIKLAKW